MSSIKVEIVVLNGDFGAYEWENWIENQFNASVLREREGERSLVIENLMLELCKVQLSIQAKTIFFDRDERNTWVKIK